MKIRRYVIAAALCLVTVAPSVVNAQQIGETETSREAGSVSRAHLPMPNTIRPDLITYDAKDPDSKFHRSREFGLLKGRLMCWLC